MMMMMMMTAYHLVASVRRERNDEWGNKNKNVYINKYVINQEWNQSEKGGKKNKQKTSTLRRDTPFWISSRKLRPFSGDDNDDDDRDVDDDDDDGGDERSAKSKSSSGAIGGGESSCTAEDDDDDDDDDVDLI